MSRLERFVIWWLVHRRGHVVAKNKREIRDILMRLYVAPRERALMARIEEAMREAGGCHCLTCAVVSEIQMHRAEREEALG